MRSSCAASRALVSSSSWLTPAPTAARVSLVRRLLSRASPACRSPAVARPMASLQVATSSRTTVPAGVATETSGPVSVTALKISASELVSRVACATCARNAAVSPARKCIASASASVNDWYMTRRRSFCASSSVMPRCWVLTWMKPPIAVTTRAKTSMIVTSDNRRERTSAGSGVGSFTWLRPVSMARWGPQASCNRGHDAKDRHCCVPPSAEALSAG